MAKGLNKVQIGLEFTADTKQAKRELNELKNSLNEVIKLPGKASSLFDDSSIREASKSAQLLQNHLQAAVNVDTGKLDLSKFSMSLKASNQSLNEHIGKILQVGPAGQRAFLSLAKSITNAEMPTRRVNKALEEMMTTMKNTARWQISSSILHGFMGAVSKAYGYAQDLNESLNDIRIVTGYNTTQMAKFAKEANKAAKALSTTTTEYTNASLIYFQQGLNDQQVKERTDITVKMANVSKQSAEVVSDQMTAVWNNFYDGSKSLEYYADVMTKLGAATASSSDEIAQGLEKFAAIADTVGLSYDYAASALATVTAETRQSADVVGTAFKTIFARIEGLSLGETLDDGTNLNKYSQALATVGVQIKDTNGEIKDMDTILEEMGTRWQTLGQDQKIALAQTVAGVRQYNQLISLMDNWDTFQDNLNTAQGSEGSLAAQAEIYAESWEAAQDRVQASAENIYDSLLNDEFFIDLTNGLAKALEAVGGLVDGMGGLKGILTAVSSIILTQYSHKIPEIFLNLKQNILTSMGLASKQMIATHKTLQGFIQKEQENQTDGAVPSKYSVELQNEERLSRMKEDLLSKERFLNDEQKKSYENKIKAVELMNAEILKLREKLELTENLRKQARAEAKEQAVKKAKDTLDNYEKSERKVSSLEIKLGKMKEENSGFSADQIQAQEEALKQARVAAAEYEAEVEELKHTYEDLDGIITNYITTKKDSSDRTQARKDLESAVNTQAEGKISEYEGQIEQRAKASVTQTSMGSQINEWKSQKNFISSSKSQTKDIKANEKAIMGLQKRMKAYVEILKKSNKELGINGNTLRGLETQIDKLSFENFDKQSEEVFERFDKVYDTIGETIGELDENIEAPEAELNKMGVTLNNVSDGATKFAETQDQMANSIEQTEEEAKDVPPVVHNMGEVVGQVGATFLSVSTMITSITSSISVFSDENATAMDKLGAGISLVMALTTGMNAVWSLSKVLMDAETASKWANSGATGFNTVMKIANAIAAKFATAAEIELTAATLVLAAAFLALIAVVAIVAAIVVKASQAFGEQAQAEYDQAKANEELIDSNQELAGSVRELIDEYQELSATGESTYDTLEKLKEQMPELIESYKELERNLGLDLGLEKLEQAYKAAQATGNWGEVEVQIKRIDAEVLEAERVVYESGAESSGKLMANAGKSGLGNLSDSKSKYNINFGNGGIDDQKAGKVFREEFANLGISDYITSGDDQTASVDLKMNLSDPTAMVNYYEGLVAVQAKLREKNLEDSDTYKQISEELSQLSESYQEAKGQAEGFLNTITEAINSAEGEDFKKLLGFSPEEVDTLIEYNTNISKMVETLAKAKGITEAEARAIIEASEAFSKFANAGARIDIMAQDLDVKDGEKDNLESIKNKLQNIYNGLSEEDKTLFLTLDIANIDPNDLSNSINKALAEAREKAIIAEVKLEAKELGFDESAFESYADILQDTNKHLEDNKGKAYKVGLQNARLSKGLVTLTESFKDNVSILAKGNRESYEYAEAIGALKDSFEEMYGYKPSTVFIEGHLEEIQKLANGDLDVLQDLQDELAKDYVLNMEVGTAINTDVVGMSTDEVRNKLIEMLDSIDTTLEIGEGTTISDDYLNSLQAMLDQGQITQEQLQTMLRSKGIEMKVTGYKEVPGPETTTYQKITTPLGTYTKTISESQKIKVPIINGDDSNIYGGTGQALTEDGEGFKSSKIEKDPNKMAQFAKTSDKDSIDTSAFEEASGKADTEEKIKEIKEETDYYHELERELAALEHQYNKISIAKERAFGKERLRLIAEERKNWEQQLKNIEESKVKAQKVATETRNKLVNNFGLSYYKDTGELANYQDIYDREQQARIDAYKTGDEEAIKAADARWEEFQTLIQRYEQEGLEKIREAEENAINLQNQIYDSYLEDIEYTVEVNLEVNEGDLEYLEYMLSKSEDDAFDAAYTVNEILGKQTQALMDQSEIYNRGIDEIFANHGVTREQAAQMSQEELKALGFTDRELNSLKEYESGLLEINTQLMENRKAVEDSLMPLYEAYGEEFDKLTAKVEYATNVMNNYKNIIDLLGKKRLGFDDEFLISMSKSQLEVSKNGLQIAKERLATAESSKAEAAAKLAQAEKALAADKDNKTLQNDVAYWKQIYEELETDVMAQTENVMALTETALQAAQDHYTTLTDSILDEFDRGLSAIGDSMEQMMSKYEASEEVDSRYLESYEKMYELNKLSRDLDTKLSKATSLQEQESLRKLLEEVNAKKAEGVEMSEHDLKILQGQVEMEQARLAVEAAREAKTQVIRRRDSEGNWGYVYTANEEAAQDALQNYEDKVYELMDLNDEYLDDLGMKILEARQMMGEEIAALREEDFASQAEYEAAIDAIKEKYTSQINYYTDEMNKALGYNKDIYGQDITNRLNWYGESVNIGKEQLIAMAEIRESDYANQEEYFEALVQATGLTLEQIKELYHQGTLAHVEEISVQIGANDDLQTSFDDTVLAQTTGFTTMDEFNDQLATSTENMVKRMDQAYKDYTEDIQGVIGTYEEFRKSVDEKINGEKGVVKSSKKAEESATNLREETEKQFGLATTAVQKWQVAYSEEMDKVIAKNEAAVKDILKTWSKLKQIDYEVPVEDPSEDDEIVGGTKNKGTKDKKGVSNVENTVDPNNADKSGADPKGPGGNSVSKYLMLSEENFNMERDGTPSDVPVYDTSNWESQGIYGYYAADKMKLVLTKYVGFGPRNGTKWWVPEESYGNDSSEGSNPQKVTYAWARSKDQNKKLPTIHYTTNELKRFDTGGYTGEWGPEGRLAMLHQKEIVLNARDTENMLAMTQMVRDIAKQIDLTAVPTNRSIAPTAIAPTNDGIEQNITIHAEFPDAVNQKEIEEAFNNLFIRVSQYANRKN